MLKTKFVPAAIYSLILVAGCAPDNSTPTGTGGHTTTGSGGSTATTGTGGAATTTGSGGGTTTTGSGGTTTATGTGGTSTTTGSGGTSAGTGGSTTTGTGGKTGAGGTTTTGTGGGTTTGSGGTTPGTGGTPTTGTAGKGGVGGTTTGTAGKGGAGGTTTGTGGTTTAGTGGATTGTGGGGPAVTVSASCKIQAWPTASGSPVTISGTKSVSGVYDGKMAVHEGSLNDCSKGDQSSTDALIEVEDGGTVKNVIMGNKVGDGIHCKGSCTIDNVWFPYVCDDAVTALADNATVTIKNSGFKNARDKTLQQNGNNSTVVIDNVYVETAGKLIRSCGEGSGCGPTTSKRTMKISNVVAIGVAQVAGVSTNDTATFTNICAWRTPTICHTYKPGSDDDATVGANGVGEGPSANCVYKSTDSHALVDKVTSGLQTDILCPGPNSIKTGSTATACVSGFDSCLKNCLPGSYGFKQVNCTAGKYADAGAGACSLPSDSATAAHFASTNMTTTTVTGNNTCSSEWSWGKDSSGKFCMCVLKPGYYQESTSAWTVWDCQTQWW